MRGTAASRTDSAFRGEVVRADNTRVFYGELVFEEAASGADFIFVCIAYY